MVKKMLKNKNVNPSLVYIKRNSAHPPEKRTLIRSCAVLNSQKKSKSVPPPQEKLNPQMCQFELSKKCEAVLQIKKVSPPFYLKENVNPLMRFSEVSTNKM